VLARCREHLHAPEAALHLALTQYYADRQLVVTENNAVAQRLHAIATAMQALQDRRERVTRMYEHGYMSEARMEESFGAIARQEADLAQERITLAVQALPQPQGPEVRDAASALALIHQQFETLLAAQDTLALATLVHMLVDTIEVDTAPAETPRTTRPATVTIQYRFPQLQTVTPLAEDTPYAVVDGLSRRPRPRPTTSPRASSRDNEIRPADGGRRSPRGPAAAFGE
jgi:hypothetical protein